MGKVVDLRSGAHLPEGPIRSWKLLALFAPFLLSLMLSLRGQVVSSWLIRGVEILLLGLLIITWVVGLRKGFPAWALPALGQVLCIMCSVGIYLVFPAQEFATPDLSFRLWESPAGSAPAGAADPALSAGSSAIPAAGQDACAGKRRLTSKISTKEQEVIDGRVHFLPDRSGKKPRQHLL